MTPHPHLGRAILAPGLLLLHLAIAAVTHAADKPVNEAPPRPNVVLILCDNLGYGDVGCYGSTLHRTPHIDRLAAEGVRFTDAYASSGVCTPSRASLMTGCYPRRINMHESDKGRSVLQPVAAKGLHPDEITIAELLRPEGYATAIFGKWHLGDQPPFLPKRQGFDTYLGIPYSDDMTARPGQPWPPLPLMRDEAVIEAPADRNTLTKRYTEAAVEFITAHRDEPFFVYLAHAMPGSTQASFASDAFRGRSQNGLWGDAVEEIDWSTGQIVQALQRLDLDEQTLIIWTNDNGAPRRNPPQGSNKPLSGWGYDTSEGAMRVPLIARWPDHIPASRVCREVCTLMDLYPTLANLAGTEVPQDRIIDGRDIRPLLTGRLGAKSPHEAVYFYFMDQLQAVRSGRWKLYLPLEEPQGRAVGKSDTARLYNLSADIGETTNVAEQHADVVERLLKSADAAREDLGDSNHPGQHQRPAGHVADPTPRVRQMTER
jgi:arylsulfatase A-like enzyme